MPCRDYDFGEIIGGQDNQKLKDHADDLAAMLCAACVKLEENKIKLPNKVGIWWRKHKKQDAKAARDKAEADRHKKLWDDHRKSALAKLTKLERMALGIK